VVAEFHEVESGKRADRPQLAAALASCRTRRALLVIAKLNRRVHNARFLLSVVEGSGEAGVVFCDLPLYRPDRLASSWSRRLSVSSMWLLSEF
jgi:hypothetical protein